MTGESHEVLTNVEGGVGFVTLNRPKAINSLNQTMVDLLATVLMSWEHEDAVHAVVLSGAGERGLCAGGDVVAVYHSARKDGVEARRFWRHEYLLNALIGRFAKPYVALMDGIVMGGGVGVSAHANTRVVTDTSKVAMPEVGIGFIPDVGGVYLLSRAPGALGLHAALTGAPFSGATPSRWDSPTTSCHTATSMRSRRRSSPAAWRAHWPPTPSNLHRARLPPNVIGSTNAMPATASPTSLRRCGNRAANQP